jgi:hypothetical protein
MKPMSMAFRPKYQNSDENECKTTLSILILGKAVCAAGVAWRAVVVTQRDLARDPHGVNESAMPGGLVALAASADDPVAFFGHFLQISLVRL